MQQKKHWFQSIRFKLLMLTLCSVILLVPGLFIQPALAEAPEAPHLLTPIFSYQKPVAVSWNNPTTVHVFAISTNGSVWHRKLNGSTLVWGSWLNLGLPPGTSNKFNTIEAISYTTNRVDLFGVDKNKRVWHKFLLYTNWSNAWTDIGTHSSGTFEEGIQVISWAPGRLDLFTRSMGYLSGPTSPNDEPFFHKWYDNGAWGPSQYQWEYIDTFYLDVFATTWGSNRIDLIGKTWGGAVKHKYWNGSSWQPANNWEDLSGQTSAFPFALSWGYNRLDIFVRGKYPSKQVYHKAWNGSAWTAWKIIGGDSGGSVTGVSWGANRMDLFEVRSSGVYHKAYSSGTWYPSVSDWEYIGGQAELSNIAATSWGSNRLDLFAIRSTDGSLWHLAWDGTGWKPTIDYWELVNP